MILIGMGILVPMVVSSSILAFMLEKQLQTIFNNRLKAGLETFSLIINNKEDVLISRLNGLASDSTLQVTMELGIISQLEKYLEAQNQVLGFSAITARDKNLEILVSVGDKLPISEHYDQTMIISQLKEKMVFRTIRVKHDNDVIGYLEGAFSLSGLTFLSHLQEKLVGDFVLWVDEDIVTSSIHKLTRESSVQSPTIEEVLILEFRGVKYKAKADVIWIDNRKLTFAVLLPFNEYQKGYWRIFSTVGIVVFVLFFLISLVLWKLLKNLISPVKELTVAVSAVKKMEGLTPYLDYRREDEFGILNRAFRDMQVTIKNYIDEVTDKNIELEERSLQLKAYGDKLELMVDHRTSTLNKTLDEMEQANKKVMDSIRYAEMIQRSLLPSEYKMSAYLTDSFVIWMPRDIIGGDIFFIDPVKDGLIVGVFDCTGHGVPGAFMTMIAFTGLRKIIRDERIHSPGEILNRLNFVVKTTLQQDGNDALSDDGLDAAICHIKSNQKRVIFAGARLPLILCKEGQIEIIKGNRQSIGYKRSDLTYHYENREIEFDAETSFYLATDGIADQIGESSGFPYGNRRFYKLLESQYMKPIEEQKKSIVREYNDYKGNQEQQDDITVIGFQLNSFDDKE